jgi:hypothetical protein
LPVLPVAQSSTFLYKHSAINNMAQMKDANAGVPPDEESPLLKMVRAANIFLLLDLI